MKTAFNTFFVYLFTVGIFYLIVSFHQLSISPVDWSSGARATFCIVASFGFLFMALIYTMIKSQEI